VVERFNRTLVAMLSNYADESGSNWPDFLQKVMAAYNGMRHPAIGMAPYTAMYKLDKSTDLINITGVSAVCSPNEFTQVREWIKSFYTITKEWDDHNHNRTRIDKPAHKAGDLVWCRDFTAMRRRITAKEKKLTGTTLPEGPGKLAPKWNGPWLITETWGNVVMTLKRIGGGDLRRAHIDQVKPFVLGPNMARNLARGPTPKKPSIEEQKRITNIIQKEKAGAGRNVEEPDENSDDSDDEIDGTTYIVERVVGHFQNEYGFWFLIQWEGFHELTWEHESLLTCPIKVTRYFKEVCEEES